MDKLNSLRQHLINNVPAIKRSPENLHVFAEDGHIHYTPGRDSHFSYHFKAVVIVTELALHADAVFVPLIVWCKHNQTDLGRDAIKFLADPLDGNSIDLRIEIPLDERVLVTEVSGGYSTEHPAEPVPEYNQELPTLLGELIFPGTETDP